MDDIYVSGSPSRTNGSVDVSELDAPDDSFVTFYRQTVEDLVGYLVWQGACLHEATDIAQDTMMTVYQRWDSIDHPRRYCFKVGLHTLARLRSRSLEDLTADLPEPNRLLRSSEVDNWITRHDLVEALRQLPPRQQQVMALTLKGFAPREIAELIGLSGDAVRANLMKARKALEDWRRKTEDRDDPDL
jgi:RNA polymerase sigma factor (sigma-70 family)